MKILYKDEIKSSDNINNDKIIKLILEHRQIKNISEFLNPPSPLRVTLADIHKEFDTKIKKVIELLKKIKEDNRMIVVYTDYDADGITGGAILWETLYLLGFNVMPYVPDRKHEGYGFSIQGIDKIKKLYNPALIISVDHGITAHEKISYAKSLGIPVIVTDHHLKSNQTSKDAVAIFHIPELSGAGVSYFFAKEIFNHFSLFFKTNFQNLTTNFQTDYLALATIGIIADLVPLTGVSRQIVYHGLKTFLQLKRVGICHIFKEAGLTDRIITPYEIGFIIAPRINALGRLEHAIDALRLLCTKKDETASVLAKKLGKKNRERQDLVEKSLEEARLSIKKTDKKIIILSSNDWNEGIIGLIASKIADEYYRPTIVITKTDGVYKGSARSIKGLDITMFLRELSDYLIDVGGHKAAAGFTLEPGKLKKFIELAEKKANKMMKGKILEKSLDVDFKIPLSKITLPLAHLIEKLQPFGMGNPQPSFYSEAILLDAKIFGKTNKHLKLIVKDPHHQMYPLELIAFSQANLFTKLSKGKTINVVYTVDINQWNGYEKLRIKTLSFGF